MIEWLVGFSDFALDLLLLAPLSVPFGVCMGI